MRFRIAPFHVVWRIGIRAGAPDVTIVGRDALGAPNREVMPHRRTAQFLTIFAILNYVKCISIYYK